MKDIVLKWQKKKDGTIGELRKKVVETYKQNTKDPKALYIIDRNSGSLGREDTNRLMHSFINSIGTDNKEVQNYQQEYLKKLISNRSRVRKKAKIKLRLLFYNYFELFSS